MSKVLVVNAHPLDEKDSKTLKVLNRFLEIYKKENPKDKIEPLNLYEENVPEIDKKIMRGWNKLRTGKKLTDSEAKALAHFDSFTQQFVNADKIVVANPLWNLGIPPRLKAWVDTIMVANKTFMYTPDGPKGLTSGKRLLHIQANGGVYKGEDPATKYIENIMMFMGVEDQVHAFVEGMDHHPEKADEIVQAALEGIEHIAHTF